MAGDLTDKLAEAIAADGDFDGWMRLAHVDRRNGTYEARDRIAAFVRPIVAVREAEVRADERQKVEREVAERLRDEATRLGRCRALHHAPPILDRLADEWGRGDRGRA